MGNLTLKPVQDGMGYFYGEWIGDDDTHVRVDVLPPLSHPRPFFVASTDGMHETDWIVFANGEEVARVKEREAIEEVLTKKLPAGQP